jgi:apolipoprotein D and lipocalin family protein
MTLPRALAALAALLLLPGCREDLDVVPDVDLQRFEGRWHEVAHFARATQKDCSGTVATYTRRADGKLDFVHECTLADGTYHGKTAIAAVRDPRTPAKLAVDFGAYVGDYWIIDLAPDYRYAVVGHPSRDYLWILSRTPALAPADLEAAIAHAEEKGFETKRLELTRAAAHEPQGTPAPAATYGCAASADPGSAGGSLALLCAGLLVAARRRRSRLR